MDRFPRSDSIVQPRAGLQTYMAQVYGWMTVGLLLTAFVAWYAANSAAVMELLFTNRVFLIGLIIAQLALVIVLSAMIQKLSAGVTTMLFMLYSALTGLTLSSIFIVYTAASIASTFVVTAGMFGAMSLYGYTTKRDLSGFGNMLFMALIGISWRVNLVSGLHQPVPDVAADLRQPPLILFHHQYPGHVSGFFFLLKTTLNKYQV